MKSPVSSTWLLILKLEEGLSACMSSDTCILLVSSSHPSGMSANPCPSLSPVLLDVVRCAFLRHHRVTVEAGLLDSPSAGSSHGQSHQRLCTAAAQLVHRQDPLAVEPALTWVVLSALKGLQPLPSAGSQAAHAVDNCRAYGEDAALRQSPVCRPQLVGPQLGLCRLAGCLAVCRQLLQCSSWLGAF